MRRHYHYLNTGWYVTLWIFAAAFLVWALLSITFSVNGRGVQTAPVQTASAGSSGGAYTAQTPSDHPAAPYPGGLAAGRHA